MRSASCRWVLFMKRGKRRPVFIGIFATRYRADVVAESLGWDRCWVPKIVRVKPFETREVES
jgi:hypothetical protein